MFLSKTYSPKILFPTLRPLKITSLNTKARRKPNYSSAEGDFFIHYLSKNPFAYETLNTIKIDTNEKSVSMIANEIEQL